MHLPQGGQHGRVVDFEIERIIRSIRLTMEDVRGSLRSSVRLGMTPLVAGITVVSLATSMPNSGWRNTDESSMAIRQSPATMTLID